MGLRQRLKSLQRASRVRTVEIRRRDGTLAQFPKSALKAAFLRNVAILKARGNGEDPPEPHPLSLAVRDAAHQGPEAGSYFDVLDVTGELSDLSEP